MLELNWTCCETADISLSVWEKNKNNDNSSYLNKNTLDLILALQTSGEAVGTDYSTVARVTSQRSRHKLDSRDIVPSSRNYNMAASLHYRRGPLLYNLLKNSHAFRFAHSARNVEHPWFISTTPIQTLILWVTVDFGLCCFF